MQPARAQSEEWGDWLKIETDSEGNTTYLEQSSIKGKGQYRFFYTLIILKDTFYGARSFVIFSSADCKTKYMRIREVSFYNANDDLMATRATDELGTAQSKSVELKVINQICQNTKSTNQ